MTSAITSACAWPARSCQPSPITLEPRVMMQPTRGLGSVVYSPCCASSRARVMQRRSKSLNATASALLVRVRQERQLIGARLATPPVTQALDFLAKCLHILEAPVDGCETHVGDLIQVAQFLHDQL